MNNDLISRKALKDAINKNTCNWPEHMWKQVVCVIIDNQPTAYDIDKVVNELEKRIEPNVDCETGEPCNNPCVDCENDTISKCIVTVIAGGIEKEVLVNE